MKIKSTICKGLVCRISVEMRFINRRDEIIASMNFFLFDEVYLAPQREGIPVAN